MRLSRLTWWALTVLLLVIVTGPGAIWAADASPPGPPQFISPPIHAPEQVQQLLNGWRTFAAPGGGGGRQYQWEHHFGVHGIFQPEPAESDLRAN